ncbi:E3 ubiquitin-protein ligase TRIM33-like [Littorina saxatilis]|uniref:Uncharacterized protein n=1 Tax=Littorina saxatilis TaxID=31220 RepID=A0AAN9BYY7_9CAEN
MAAESLIQSVIKCPICLEAYVDPRMLPCLHSFCQKCLSSYIENCTMTTNQNYFTCPVCREEIYPPHPYRPLFQWSVQFRSNFIMMDLASCLTEVAKGKEEGDVKGEVCFPCSKQMPFPKEAEHFCLDCSHPYCEACMQVHMSIPSCQKHSIVPIDDHPSREQHQKQRRHCSEHPEEVVKMFCEDCSELLCPMCALMKHRQCSKLNSVTPMAAARRLQLETSQRNLISILDKAKEKQAKLKEEKEVLSTNITSSLREMDEAYDSLITKIKEQKRSDMLKTHEVISKTQKHLVSCEEQISVFIRVLEQNVTKTQSRQLITSDIELLQEVSLEELREAEKDVAAVIAFLSKIDTSRFDVPGVARAKLEELKKMVSRTSLTTRHAGDLQGATASNQTAAATPKPPDPEHTPAKLSAVGNNFSPAHHSFALQLQQERLACRSVLSTSSDISAASTSSSEGSMACGNSSDGQRNPFSFTSSGKKSVRRPTARPRHSLARKALPGGSVFSVKHPVVTAANSTVKQASPKRSSSNLGFVFVPAKSVTALFSQFKPIPKGASADPASDDTLLNIMPSTSPMSGAHTLPKPTLPKPAGAGADLVLPSSRGTNTQHSVGQTPTSSRPQIKTAKLLEQSRKALNSLSVTSSSTMTSPITTNSTVQGGTQSRKPVEVLQNGDHPTTPDGASASAEAATPVGRLSLLAQESMVNGAAASPKPVNEVLPKPEMQKLRTTFKICPASAGDLRRPIISDFALLPNGRLAVVDRANSRVKVVVLMREGQDGLCPSVDLTKPHGVCHMSGDLIAVVSHVAKTLQLVSVGNHQLSLQHIHNTCRGYLNIARLSPTVLAARFSLGVHILDVGGPALRLKVAIVNDNNGKPLFQSPNSMCTTQDGKIVILDGMTMEVSCWDHSGALQWCVIHAGPAFPRSVCSVGLRRLYIISCSSRQNSLECLNASSGKLLHSIKLDYAASLEDVSTMVQDGQDRILINNHEEIVCFDWV